MDLHLAAKIRCFFLANFRNSWLLRAMCTSNQGIFISNLYGPNLFRGSLVPFGSDSIDSHEVTSGKLHLRNCFIERIPSALKLANCSTLRLLFSEPLSA